MIETWKSRRILAAAAALAATALVTGCGGEARSDGGASGDALSVTLVTPERAGDGGPTDQMLAGLAQAEEEFGLATRHIEATDPSTFESTLTNLGTAGTDVVIVAYTQFTDAIKAVAPQYPDTQWVHLYADPYEPGLDNVQSIGYDTNGPAYLAGVLAATASKTGQVGFIGGTAIPQVNADFHAFEAGVEATDPSVTITGAVVGSWTDTVKGQQVGQRMFSSGVDYVLAYGGGSSLGVVKAAQQSGGAMVIYDGQVRDTVADVVPATATQQYGTTIYNEVSAIVDGTWEPGHKTAGLADGGTVLDRSPAFADAADQAAVATRDEAFAEVEKVKEQIVAGEITVPADTTGF